MTVAEFVKFDVTGGMFQLVDASRVGYMTAPTRLCEADRNVVVKYYGNNEVIGVEALKKNTIRLYVK